MVATLAPTPVWAADEDGKATDEHGAPGPAGGHGPVNAPRSGGDGSEGPPDIGLSGFVEGICAVGETLWVANRSHRELRAYDRFSGERDEDSDLPLVEPAEGVWCDGETVWYTSGRDDSTIFAYDMATGTRDEDREFDISALDFSRGGNASPFYFWLGPLGIASDGDTMWVATNSQVVGNRLYALDMATKEPTPEADIALGDFYPRGLWSDGDFLWVASTRGTTVRAYDIATRTRTESLDLDVSPGGAWGLWSDGDHMWVCDYHRETVRAHPMPEAYGPHLDTLEVSGVKLVSLPSRQFRGRVARGTATVTVTAVAADDAHTVTFGTDDADDGTEGHQWSLELGDNTLEVTVSDGADSHTYTITVVKVELEALSDDATLSSLSVDGAGVDGFASGVHRYQVKVDHDVVSATVAATAAEPAAELTITPADADPDTEGRQVALDVGSNVVTAAVVATDGVTTAAYTLSIFRRGDPDQLADFVVRGFREGICAVGDTLWVSSRSYRKLYAYDRFSGERDEHGDLPLVEPARGVWCDGETLWYTSGRDHSTIFAYDMETGTRDEDREFDISALDFSRGDNAGTWYFWAGPLGIASDGETMWVATNSRVVGNRLYALDMDTKEPKPEADIALRGFYPRGLWSDGEFLWVATTSGSTVRAYDIATQTRTESLDLDVSPGRSWGLWSDGEHMWVFDFHDETVQAYPMPEAYGPHLETLEVSGVELVSLSSTEWRGHVARGTASVTVTAVAADDAHTVTFGTVDADDVAEGHQWSLALGDNTLEVTVSDGTDSRTNTITVVKIDVDALSDDATLSSLSIDGTAVAGFAADMHDYGLRVDHDAASVTVAAAATEAAAVVEITPADADPVAEGHQVALAEGSNVVTVAVAATDGLATAVYTLEISRMPSAFAYDGFADISGLAHRRSMDIWAGAQTRWVSYDRSGDEAVLAYDASTGERQPGRDIAVRAAGNKSPQALWSDGASLYVLDAWKSMVFQYSLAEDGADGFGAHRATVSLEGIGEDDARGLWSDGEHMWVANRDDAKVYAYEVGSWDRVSGEDFDTLAAAGNSMPVDLWSDGQVMWVLDKGGRKIYAYDLDSKARLEHLDFQRLQRGNGWPSGLWSDGAHMWVSDADDTRAYAYVMPAVLALDTLDASGVDLARASATEYRGHVARGTETVTVTARAADGAHTVTFGTDDADGNTEGHQWSLALGDNTLEVTVSDGADSRTYTVTVVKIDVEALSDDATLSSLTVDGTTVDGFASDVHSHRLKVDHDVVSATVAATAAEAAAEVTITPADADPDTDGHQVALDAGSNVVTVAVAATDGVTEAAYTLTIFRRGDPDKFPGITLSGFNEGICAVGDTLWVAYRSKIDLPAFDRSTGERETDNDLPIENLENPARGVWCDGETMWYTSVWDHSTIFAYDMETGTRDEDREFDISALDFSRGDNAGTWYFWSGPLGIASDGETMWVATNSRVVGNRLYALDMATKEPKPEADIALGGFYPRGLWSDGEFLWVATTSGSTVRAYDIATQTRTESLDLDVSPGRSWGLWSDGEHMWVCDFHDETVRAYPMPEAYGLRLDTVEVSGVDLVRSSWGEWRGHVARDTASVTVTAVAADDEHTVTFGTDDADPDTEGHQWSLALGDNTLEVTVSDGALSRTNTITVVRVDVDALSDDATLSSLSVDGAAVDGFASDVHSYRVEVAQDVVSVTVAATATVAAAQVAITPADADPDAAGHQIALARGANPARVAVAATDGVATAVYTLEILRELPAEDVDGFGEKGRRLAYLWSNGSTVWVSEPKQDAIEAYELASGRSRGSERIGGLGAADNDWARGIWSNGDTIWVADYEDNKLYAYTLDGGARRPDLDIDTLEAAGNTSPRGIWSNGDTIWVVDTSDRKLYAYELDGGARMPGSDIDTLGAAGNASPRDVWSDGDTIWVADSSDAKLYAYALNGGARRAELDFDTLEAAGNANPRGIWSNGDIMWVSDPGDDKLYAYNMPARTETQQQTQQQDEPLQTLQAQQDEQAQQAQQDEQAQQAQQDEQALQSQQGGTQQQSQQQDGTQQQTQQDEPLQTLQAQQDEQALQTQQDDPQQDGTEQQTQQDDPQQDDTQQGGTQQDDPQQDDTQQQAQQQVQQDEPQQGQVQEASAPNVPAAGVPVVAGAVRVGETLVADTSGVADADGMAGAVFTFVWLADGVVVAGAAGAAYTLVEADAGRVFEVRVSFVDDGGHGESLASAAAGPVLGIGPPGAPRGLVVTAGDREVTLSWEPPADNGNAPVRKYRIEWRIGGRDYDESHLGITRDTTYTKTHLANGVEYIFWVSAENGSGYSLGPHGPASEEVSATPSSGSVMDLATPVLSGPETLHFGMVKLHWDDIDGADRYMVQHYNLDDANWQDLPTAGIDIAVHGSSAVVTNLNQGIWWLRVGAASCTATSEWSEIEALYITDAPDWHDVPIPPVEPGDETEPCPEVLATPVLSAPETLHYGMVKLDWDDIDGADRYTVQHYNLDDANWQDLPTAGIDIALHGSSAVVTNLSQGIWWLRVGAASCTATSEWSEIEAFYILDATDWQNVPTPAIEPGDQPQPCP